MTPTTEQITYDASAIKSRAFRRHFEGALEGFSFTKAEGVWQSIIGERRLFPRARTLVVGDLHEVTSAVSLDDLAAGPSFLSYVLLVRTTLDEKRLAEPDVALRLNDERFFLLDWKCTEARGTESQLTRFVDRYLSELIDRLQSDRLRTARFSAIDGVLWLEFGDGLTRAKHWDSLPFAKRLDFTPIAASVREQGRAVQLVNSEGSEIDIDAGAMRAVVDPVFARQSEDEDRTRRAALGARIRELREESDLSQEQLSSRTGLAQESLSRIENGHRDPRLATLRKLAEGLGLTLSDLLAKLAADE
jgi:DNA-binding XRE family transcriptional regulator